MSTTTMPLAHQEQLINSMTRELNKRFCDDRKLPLKIHTGKIFIDRIKLFGEYDRYIEYCHEVQRRFENTQDYFEYYNKVKDSAINYIKESRTFKLLNAVDMNSYACGYSFPQTSVYKANNIGKLFISIDMSKANFSSLVHFGRESKTDFFSSFDYAEFMRQFTDIKHIIESKYIRQVIFGNCNPKRQVTYEKYLMGLVLDVLINGDTITADIVHSMCSDEIILRVDGLGTDKIRDILNEVHNLCNIIPLKVEVYQLGRIDGSEAFIKKIFNDIEDKSDFTYELKCVNPDEAPFVHRLINNQPIKEDDSIFWYNGKLAKLIETPELSINFTGGYN